jgi:hypothetical protein
LIDFQAGEDVLRDYRNRQSSSSKQKKHKDLLVKMTVLSDSLTASDSVSKEGDIRMTKGQISIETPDLVFAGTDTTSTTITYLYGNWRSVSGSNISVRSFRRLNTATASLASQVLTAAQSLTLLYQKF